MATIAPSPKPPMYCEDSKGTAIDHFWPKADYPDRAFTWLNYVLACSECNSKKNKRFPLDAQGAPLLLNPVEEEPLDHLAFSPSTGKYETLTRRGEESQDIYGLDRSTLVRGRLVTWLVLKALLASYSKHRAAGDSVEADKQEDAVKQLQFSGVFAAFLQIAQGPGARTLIGEEHLEILENHPEIATWL
ncbi:MAG: HNH endonuclease [Thermoanaerobaculia bacterium]